MDTTTTPTAPQAITITNVIESPETKLRFVLEDRPTLRSAYLVKAYRNGSDRSYAYYSFRDEAGRLTWVNHEIENAKARAQRRIERAAERKAATVAMRSKIKAGEVLHGSWGYDQTNCEIYQVTDVRGSVAILRPIAQKTVAGSEGFMSCEVQAEPYRFTGPEIRRRITAYGVKLHEHCTLSPVEDLSKSFYSSWYA